MPHPQVSAVLFDMVRLIPATDNALIAFPGCSHPRSSHTASQDGLLIDSERLYTVATNEVLKPYGKSLTWEVRLDPSPSFLRDSSSELIRCLSSRSSKPI